MISKINRIKGVGKFANNCKCIGDIKFDKFNIIYAGNGHGKTTLTSIIRSFRDNNPELIKKRKTINFSEEQEVQLLIDENKMCCFSKGSWNKTYYQDDIKIFDIFFVNENVYSGFEFSAEQKKNLHKFVLGSHGVKLASDINQIKKDIEEKRKSLKEAENKIVIKIKEKLDIELQWTIDKTFETFKEDKNIENKICEKRKELQVAEENENIKVKSNLSKITRIKIDIDMENLKSSIRNSIVNISETFLKKFEAQKRFLEENQVGNAEEWLEKGLIYLQYFTEQEIGLNQINCPFCNQSLTNAEETITSYIQYFNKEYNQLKKDVLHHKKSLDKLNIELLIEQLERQVEKNITLAEFWNKYVYCNFELLKIDFQKEEIISLLNKIKDVVVNKIQQPIISIDDKEVINFNLEIIKLNEQIEDYNKYH